MTENEFIQPLADVTIRSICGDILLVAATLGLVFFIFAMCYSFWKLFCK